MLRIQNTQNFTGIAIIGDIFEFRELVDALYAVTVAEEDAKNREYFDISTRVLGLCYDIRHASMGDREVIMLDNDMSKDLMQLHGMITPEKNVYYKANYLYPEMIFVNTALNSLITAYMRKITGKRHSFQAESDPRVMWDKNIAKLRLLQSSFADCCKESFADTSYKRWIKMANDPYRSMNHLTLQYLDALNIRWINMDREKRKKNWFNTARRILEPEQFAEYREIEMVVSEAAKKHNCPKSDIQILGTEYPDEIEW